MGCLRNQNVAFQHLSSMAANSKLGIMSDPIAPPDSEDSEHQPVSAVIDEQQARDVVEVEAGGQRDVSLLAGPEMIVQSRLDGPVLVSDRIPARHRRFEDLFEAVAAFVGIVFVVLVNIYANTTTAGVETDLQNVFEGVITSVNHILFMPFELVEGFFVIAAPVALVISLLVRGELRTIINAIATALVAGLIGWGLLIAIPHLPKAISGAFIVETSSGRINSVNVALMVLIAMMTVAGTMSSSRVIRLSWWGVWLILLFTMVSGKATVPGVLLTVLLGRLIGCISRLIVGFTDGRAEPTDLVEACLNLGLDPVRIVRSDLNTTREPLETWEVTESEEVPDFRRGQINPPLKLASAEVEYGSFQVTSQFRQGMGRLYQLLLREGRQLDMHVSDPDQGLASLAGELWQNLRLKGIARWISPGLKPGAERVMLTAASAASAGVRTPRPLGLARAGSSVAVVWETLPPVASLFDLVQSGAEVSDDLLDQAWAQLKNAHERGICHRNLDRESIRVDRGMNLWIVDWSQGDLGASETARLIDMAQMLVHLSLVSSPERAMESAQRELGQAELLASGLMLQSAILPKDIRSGVRRTDLLKQLRDELSKIAPTSQAPEPIKVQRFSARSVIMAVLAVTALVVVFGSLNFDAVVLAVRTANPWLILVAFVFGCLPWLGAAIPLVAFSPKKIGLWDTTLVQMAGSIVALVAPAGLGPAAVNLRYLNKQKINTPVAVATVTLVQISQFLTSVALLIIVVVATGTSVNLNLPTMTIIWVFAAVATVLVALISVPRLRRWLISKIEPAWNQAYPQFLWILGHPKELGIAFLGNMLMNVSYIAAFGFSLAAFGQTLNPWTLAITYLISVTIGSVIPTPGGIGPVEAALTAGLQVAGIPAAVALSAAVVFRLVTFYGRIPIGWLALRRCESKGLL